MKTAIEATDLKKTYGDDVEAFRKLFVDSGGRLLVGLGTEKLAAAAAATTTEPPVRLTARTSHS